MLGVYDAAMSAILRKKKCLSGEKNPRNKTIPSGSRCIMLVCMTNIKKTNCYY